VFFACFVVNPPGIADRFHHKDTMAQRRS